MMILRTSGILLPVSALPSEYGIGTLGKEAYAFVDFLNRSKQHYWQILPLGHTGYSDSPYQCFSAFAGNPYYIDPMLLFQSEVLFRPPESVGQPPIDINNREVKGARGGTGS